MLTTPKKRGYIKQHILRAIEESDPNSIFFISDFIDIASPETVRKIFFQATINNLLKRAGQGIYIKPKDSRFGIVPVPLETVAQKIAERDKCQILPTGNTAANIIGLSTQVPMNLSYITSGSTRTIFLGRRKLSFRHASPKNFASKGKVMPLLIQGIREIGEDNLSDNHYAAISRFIKATYDPYFKEDLLLAPIWIQRIINRLRKKEENETLAATE